MLFFFDLGTLKLKGMLPLGKGGLVAREASFLKKEEGLGRIRSEAFPELRQIGLRLLRLSF